MVRWISHSWNISQYATWNHCITSTVYACTYAELILILETHSAVINLLPMYLDLRKDVQSLKCSCFISRTTKGLSWFVSLTTLNQSSGRCTVALFPLLDLAKVSVVGEECVPPYEVLVVKYLIHTSSVQLHVETYDGAVFVLARATVRVTYKWSIKDKINILLNKQYPPQYPRINIRAYLPINGGYCVYYPSNIFRSMCNCDNCRISLGYPPVLARRLFNHVKHLGQLRASENIWSIIVFKHTAWI